MPVIPPSNPLSALFESVDEIFSGRSGTPFSMDGKREYVKNFRVIVKNKYIGPMAVCAAPYIPLPYSIYQSGNGLEFDLLALLVNKQAKLQNEDDWKVWIVTCTYSTVMPEGGAPTDPGDPGVPGSPETGGRGAANNPELEPPDIEWDFEVVQKPLSEDLEKQAFLNTAKDPITPAPVFEVAYPVLSITRNQNSFDWEEARKYAFALNSDKFLNAEPGQAQCLPPRGRMTFRGPLKYWRVSYKIRFNFDDTTRENFPSEPVLPVGQTYKVGWHPRFLNVGVHELIFPGPNDPPRLKKRAISDGGQITTEPQLLDRNGRRILPDADGKVTPYYLTFRVYPSVPFAPLLRGL